MLGYFLKRTADDKRNQEIRFQEMLTKEEAQKVDHQIEGRLEPIYKELEDIRKRILSISDKEEDDFKHTNENFDLIIASYKYRLVQLCKEFLNQGFMYQYQYDHLNEFYTLYVKLGGNGEAKRIYTKVCNDLEVRPNPENM